MRQYCKKSCGLCGKLSLDFTCNCMELIFTLMESRSTSPVEMIKIASEKDLMMRTPALHIRNQGDASLFITVGHILIIM